MATLTYAHLVSLREELDLRINCLGLNPDNPSYRPAQCNITIGDCQDRLIVTPRSGSSCHHLEECVTFAKYHHMSAYATIEDGKVAVHIY